MYLARKETGPRQYQYALRESYRRGDVFYSREVAELGPDPGRCLVYPDESSFHLDEEFLRRLRERGVSASYTELEELFFPFVDPYIKNRLQPFCQRYRYRNWQPASQGLLARIMAETQGLDRRRIHFLRLGRTSAETVDKTLAMYTVLLDKSRDEIEQMILEREQTLPPREYQSYLFTIFDVQRFFHESYVRAGRSRRRSTPPAAAVSRSQAFAIFAINAKQLATMRKQDLTRLYRQKAFELHPDKGGDPEQFIRLAAAYEALLSSLQ